MSEKGGLDLVRSMKSRIWLLLIGVVIVLLSVVVTSAVSQAEPHDQIKVLSLEEALTRALQEHPTVDTAQGERDSKELTLARRSAMYAPRLSTSFKPLSVSIRQQESELVLGEALSITGSLSTMAGWEFSAANHWQSKDGDQEKSGLTLKASLKLWPPSQYDTDYLGLLQAKESAVLAARVVTKARMEALIDTYRRYRLLQIDGDRLEVYREEHEAKLAKYHQMVGKAEQRLAATVEVIAALQEKEETLAVYQRACRDYQRELRSFLSDLSLDGERWKLESLPDSLSTSSLEITLDEAVSLALEADITLVERNQALAAAHRQANAAKSANGIELSLGGNAEFAREKDVGYEAYVSFSYPLMDGGLRELERQEAHLTLEQAEKAVQAQHSKVCLEVESKFSEVQWLEDQMHIASLNYEKVALQHNAKILQADKGLIPEAEAEASKRSLEQTRLDWLEAIVAYEMARLELVLMTGQTVDLKGGFSIDAGGQEIN